MGIASELDGTNSIMIGKCAFSYLSFDTEIRVVLNKMTKLRSQLVESGGLTQFMGTCAAE